MGREVGRKIGATKVDMNANGVGWGEFLLVKISIDLSKPLSKGWMLKLQGESTWVVFQYRRLLRYCFQCGVIRHGRRGEKQSMLRNHESSAPVWPWFMGTITNTVR